MRYIALVALLFAGCAGQPSTPSPPGGSSSSVPSSSGSPATAPAPKSTESGKTSPSRSAESARTASAPEPSAASTTDTGAGGGSAQTPDERKAAIDRKLDDSLGTFDKELKKEQERTAQERDARDASGTTVGGSAQPEAEGTAKKGEEEDESGSAATEGQPSAGTPDKTADGKKADRNARPGDLKSDKDRAAAANGASSGSGTTAREIPDGSDDDIVAKRLRKAAEQETDPELKDRLWKEYVEYKKNAGK